MGRFSQIAVLVVVWLVVLQVPSLRTAFRAQLQGSPLQPFSVLPNSQGLNAYWESRALRQPNERDFLLQAALEYPQNSEKTRVVDNGALPPQTVNEVLPSPVFPGTTALYSHRETVRRLAVLVEKFPHDAVILAIYLRAAYPRYPRRMPAEMAARLVEPSGASLPVQGEILKPPPDYSAADLERAIALAARGAQLEPDNGFFDWVKCGYLLLAWRDGEALQALESAARKPWFDEHLLGQLQSEQRAYEKLLNRPLVAEEKMHLMSRLPLPQLSQYRKITDLLVEKIKTAKGQGQHKKVLQMASVLGQTGTKMRQSPNFEIGAIAAGTIERRAYQAPIEDELDGLKQLKAETRLELAPLLSRSYAVRHGRPDVAAQARQSQSAFEKYRENRSAALPARLYGLPYYEWFASYLLWRVGVLFLALLPLALLVPVVIWGLAQEPRYREQLKWQESTPDEIPYKGEVKKGVWACAGVRALGVYLVVGAVATFILQREEWLLGWGRRVIRCFGGEMSFFEASFWNLSDLDGAAGRLVVLIIVPLLFGGLFTVWRSVAWQKLMNGDARKQPLWSRLLGFLLTGFMVQALLLFAFSGTESGFFEGSHWPLLGIVLCTGALLLEQFLQWRKRNYRLETVRYGLRLLYRSLAIWLVVGSVLYFCTLMIALPLQHRAEAKIDQVLSVGEMRAMQQE